MSAIHLEAVSKTYPGAATATVHAVDLDLNSGSFVVILGPSGCGKSTMLRMIAGLESITSGELRIGGIRMNEREPKERGCAMVFQNYALYPHMSVGANIGYPLKVAGIPRKEREARVREVAASLSLDGFLERRPSQLSGGQRQRVAMGRAMVRRPKVFLFDEPLSNLDATLRVQMRAELRRLHDSLGVTSVLVTHDQVEAMTLADRLVIMQAGRVEQVGSPREVYERPATRFVAGFLGSPAMSLLEGQVSPGGGEVLLAKGMTLPLAGKLLPGQKVLIGIRPEHVGQGSIDAICEMVEDIGTSHLVHVRVAGQPLIVQRSVETPIARGDHLSLGFPPAKLHVFEVATGRRLDPIASPVPAGEVLDCPPVDSHS
ncbi:sn-glycerol-3-phosphate ABC transporter ATP-binding protein UgpC [Roseomonas mucosa]|uniref:Sn-glycerol-3-phosphate ABC transporter ATP-binding protein UgpC n=1 Tax=Roseomonas mucosa TaxID=207340 RepID=A0A1S8D0K4_9PROT|nr:sn-glycerol-3-phosphate ABC transporter ATP-binding protein UgpC [Roseomonas mucosa]ONH81294.1 sn-glycerol-3-phosphate ABC transporter ATP-binding protein UgpC [Roseomonas mucosa]